MEGKTMAGELFDLIARLKAEGRTREIEDASGNVQPSQEAIDQVEREHPGLDGDLKRQCAAMQTLIDFAKDCRAKGN
jgi:hypothetical protein